MNRRTHSNDHAASSFVSITLRAFYLTFVMIEDHLDRCTFPHLDHELASYHLFCSLHSSRLVAASVLALTFASSIYSYS